MKGITGSATLKTGIQGSKNDKTGFADLVWKPRVLIEMIKRGEDLNKHYTKLKNTGCACT
jgi:hypothetical protein